VWGCFGREWDAASNRFLKGREAAKALSPWEFTETDVEGGIQYLVASVTRRASLPAEAGLAGPPAEPTPNSFAAA